MSYLGTTLAVIRLPTWRLDEPRSDPPCVAAPQHLRAPRHGARLAVRHPRRAARRGLRPYGVRHVRGRLPPAPGPAPGPGPLEPESRRSLSHGSVILGGRRA